MVGKRRSGRKLSSHACHRQIKRGQACNQKGELCTAVINHKWSSEQARRGDEGGLRLRPSWSTRSAEDLRGILLKLSGFGDRFPKPCQHTKLSSYCQSSVSVTAMTIACWHHWWCPHFLVYRIVTKFWGANCQNLPIRLLSKYLAFN